MQVGVIGVGYVGLVTGVVLASKGHHVTCLDKDKTVIKRLKKGEPHFYEKGIGAILQKTLKSGNINFESAYEKHLSRCSVVFICVDTPTINGKIDYTNFSQAAGLVAKVIKDTDKFISVVVKSTVLPGTTSVKVKKIIQDISGKKLGCFGLGANPEFLREGTAINDFLNPDRIIIGSEDKPTRENLLTLYSTWRCDKIITNSNTAEFAKYVNNSLLSLLISFGNEMANISLSDKHIKLDLALRSLSLDKRINPVINGTGRINPEILSYFTPGPGFGGSCLPKDIKAFSSYAQGLGVKTYMLSAIQKTNTHQPGKIVSLVEKFVIQPYTKKYLVLGFSHKPNTDDARYSPSKVVIEKLIAKGAEIILHDPASLMSAKLHFKNNRNVSFTNSWLREIESCDVIIILTNWKEYRQLSSRALAKKLTGKFIVDTRLMFTKNSFKKSAYISF